MQQKTLVLVFTAMVNAVVLTGCGTKPRSTNTTVTPAPATPAATQSVQIGTLRLLLLGSEEKNYRGRSATILTFKDSRSGQLFYFESALRVVLKRAGDMQTFINTYPAMQLRTSNALYTEVRVSPEHISSTYSQASQDPRVKSISFLPLSIPRTDRNNG